jgi:NhaA family Na+:H+ antiporter
MLKFAQRTLNQFIHSQSLAGVVLALAALLALIASNSPLSGLYQRFVEFPGELRLGGDALVLSKSLLHWVNDLWMAVFFFLVGLEIKRELLDGELASVRQAMLPVGAALGGMLLPALIYMAINAGDAVALRGWAIPAATDIAFALGILVLLGSRVSPSLKVFLTAVAIIDDLGAILIIAFFYTEALSLSALLAAGAGVLVLLLLNRAKVMAIGP